MSRAKPAKWKPRSGPLPSGRCIARLGKTWHDKHRKTRIAAMAVLIIRAGARVPLRTGRIVDLKNGEIRAAQANHGGGEPEWQGNGC